MTFRERYQKWKAGELVYSAGKILPHFASGEDGWPSMTNRNNTDSRAFDEAMALTTEGEGFRPYVYYDKVGKRNTAGFGFTDPEDLHAWTESAARKRLNEMFHDYDKILRNSEIKDWYINEATSGQRAAMMDLLHQGGKSVLREMPKFRQAIIDKNYNEAARLFDFAKTQTPRRYNLRRDAYNKPERRTELNYIPVTETTLPNDAIQAPVRPMLNLERAHDMSPYLTGELMSKLRDLQESFNESMRSKNIADSLLLTMFNPMLYIFPYQTQLNQPQ